MEGTYILTPSAVDLWGTLFRSLTAVEQLVLEQTEAVYSFARESPLSDCFPKLQTLALRRVDLTKEDRFSALVNRLKARRTADIDVRCLNLDRRCRITHERLEELRNVVPQVTWSRERKLYGQRPIEEALEADPSLSEGEEQEDNSRRVLVDPEDSDIEMANDSTVLSGGLDGDLPDWENESAESSDADGSEIVSDWDYDWTSEEDSDEDMDD
jgi:hypothetical protein